MPVPSAITDLSQTAGSNYPSGGDSPSVLDDVQRAHASFIALLRDGKGLTNPVTLASATTTDIGGQNAQFVEISGTTTITSFGTTYNGPRFLRFTGALTLTHNATTLNLPGAANITTAAGDTCIAVPNQALNGWNVVSYQASGVLIAGNRITGDFSNATVANRVMFQTSTVNGSTIISTIPNGTGNSSYLFAHGAADPTNSSVAQFGVSGVSASFRSEITGTGTYLPMTFYTGGSERMRIATDGSSTFNGLTNFASDISLTTGTDQYVYFDGALHLTKSGTGDRLVIDTSGNVGIGAASSGAPLYVYSTAATAKYIHAQHSGSYNSGLNVQNSVSNWYAYVAATTGNFEFFRGSGTGDVVVISPVGLGYGTGAGGTVTQATSKATAVTLNKPTGQITMNNAALAGNSGVAFLVNNSLVSATDTIVASITSNSVASITDYAVTTFSQAGGFYVSLRNQSAGSLSNAVVINFAIIKGATA